MSPFVDYGFDSGNENRWQERNGARFASIEIDDSNKTPSQQKVLAEIAWILIGALTVALASSMSLYFGFLQVV